MVAEEESDTLTGRQAARYKAFPTGQGEKGKLRSKIYK